MTLAADFADAVPLISAFSLFHETILAYGVRLRKSLFFGTLPKGGILAT